MEPSRSFSYSQKGSTQYTSGLGKTAYCVHLGASTRKDVVPIKKVNIPKTQPDPTHHKLRSSGVTESIAKMKEVICGLTGPGGPGIRGCQREL